MEEHLTTRQVAEALSVSESSVKRWCNNGVIPTVRTVGGHRRIPLSTFLKFLEDTDRTVTAPIAGIIERTVSEPVTAFSGDPRSLFHDALSSGEESKCRELLTAAYASKESIAWLADEFIASTMKAFGDEWSCGDLEVYQERRGCEICSRLLYEFRRLIPEPPENGPLAIGGAPEGDLYSLPSQIVELVLRECGWRAMNLGSNLPIPTLAAAVAEHKPRLLWLSVSHLDDRERFVRQYQEMCRDLPAETMVVIGGRALDDEIRPNLEYTGHCDNMQQLSSFAKALHGKRHSIESSEN
ncbi:MAG: helix-turn-helix domain-containing protein [Aureliella sp.]